MNDQDPRNETFLPARYKLWIYDINDRQGHLSYYQAETAFPNFNKGHILKTAGWSMGLEGQLLLFEEIHHSARSTGIIHVDKSTTFRSATAKLANQEESPRHDLCQNFFAIHRLDPPAATAMSASLLFL